MPPRSSTGGSSLLRIAGFEPTDIRVPLRFGSGVRTSGQGKLGDYRGVIGLGELDVRRERGRLVVQQLVVDLGVLVEGQERARREDVIQHQSPAMVEEGVPGALGDRLFARDHWNRGRQLALEV